MRGDLISLESNCKGARNIFAYLNPFRDDIAETSEIVRHPRVDPEICLHPRSLQSFRIRDALIHQGIIFRQDDECRSEAAQVSCLKWGETPVVPVRFVCQIIVEHPL